MTVVNPKSISGINSITTGSGSDNLLTIHTSDASSTERVRINSSGDVIVGSGITVSPDGNIFATGITTVGTGLSIGDNVAATFGDSGDLEISHNGSDSIINDAGTGYLKLITNGAGVILEKSNAEPLIRAFTDGAVELYHDNSKKLETASGGVTLTGDLSIDDKIVHTGDTDTAIRFSGADTITAETAGSEALRIDSNGHVAVKLTDPHLYYSKDLVVKAASEGGITIRNTNSGDWNYILFASGDTGNARYDSYIGVDHGNNKVRISTNETVSAKNVELRSDGNFHISDGNLVVASGHGIDFSATGDGTGSGSVSELFDDYEEGTWTGSTVTGSATFTGTIYTRIGRTVYFQGKVGDFTDRSSANSVVISGLPFTSSNGLDQVVGNVMYRYLSSTVYHSTYFTSGNQLQFYGGHTNDFAVMQHNMLSASSTFLYFNGAYQI